LSKTPRVQDETQVLPASQSQMPGRQVSEYEFHPEAVSARIVVRDRGTQIGDVRTHEIGRIREVLDPGD